MERKRLAIIGTVGVPAIYGGFETLVENLLDLLPQHYEVTVFCEAEAYSQKLAQYKNANLVYLNFKANGFQSIIYDILSILKSFKKNDYLLVLGVSGGIALPIIKMFFKGKILTNIDGLEWKRNKWNFYAKRFLKFSERLAVMYSDYIIADNEHIQKYVLKEYQKPSILIAYGGDHVERVEKDEYMEKYSFLKEKYLFTVCRIEPENNIRMLIEAYIRSECPFPYIIIGNWQASEFGQGLFAKYESIPNLILLTPIYDPSELNALRSNCFYYLHGHSAGGTNPSLVEAMYLGLPIIAFDVAYNRATTFGKATYFLNKEQLVALLNDISNTENLTWNKRNLSAKKMTALAEENYKWSMIANQYVKAMN